jgi:hypothetical protein
MDVSVFSSGCLQDLERFLAALNKAKKKKKEAEA